MIPKEVLEWLSEDSDPSVKYRTLTELLDYDKDHPEVISCKSQINNSGNIQAIFQQISDDGTWSWLDSYDAPEYGIGYLAELAVDCTDNKVTKAIDRYLDTQLEDGSFLSSYSLKKHPDKPQQNDNSCYYALTLRGLLKLGYKEDERFKKAMNFVLSQSRWDGGYLCTKSYVREKTKSCYRGSKNMLLLFSEMPELWNTKQCRELIDYFLERKIIYTRSDHTKLVQGEPSTTFPFHYRFGLIEVLYALSKLGLGNNEAVSDSWQYLETKKDTSGKYYLDWALPKCSFDAGKKGLPNKWVTLYAYLAYKFKNTP